MALTRSDPRPSEEAAGEAVRRLREQLRALDDAYARGHHGRWSASRRADLLDACLVELYLASGPPERTALVAIGGYGRGELAPASDIDLLLLHGGGAWRTQWGARRDASVKELAEQLLYPLWDAGFTVGHAVRSPRECATQAAERLDVRTAMLDARLLAGDEALFSSMRDLVRAPIRKDPRSFLRSLRTAAAERAERFGSVSHLLEPDLKEGAGGLRDVHTISWAAATLDDTAAGGRLDALERVGAVRKAERAAIEDAEEFLARCRSALHLETGKHTDRLHLEHQPWLAEAMGFRDEPELIGSDALMRGVFEHARRVEHVREAVLERLEEAGAAGARPDARSLPSTDDPEAILVRFADAAEGEPLAPGALDRIEQASLPDEIRWTPAMREAFVRILAAGSRGIRALEAMDVAGLLTRYLPEWADVRCRPQRDPFHRYTVDMHLLQAAVELSRLLADPPDHLTAEARDAAPGREAVLLGALLHDIGKVGRGEHVAVGVEIARAVLERVGADAGTTDLVLFLVREHLLLSDTATRRDLEDENLVLDVAARIGDTQRLAALFLLTRADAAATGPHAWTPWRAALVHDLVTKVRHVLERGDMGAEAAVRLKERSDLIRRLLEGEDGEAVERFIQTMPRSYLLTVLPERAIRHFHLVQPPPGSLDVRTQAEPGARPGAYGLTVVAHDRPGLLARVAGALALSGLSILSAQVFTTEDGVAVDLFEVEGLFEEEIDEERWRRFRTTLRKALEGRLGLEHRVREKRGFYPTPRQDIAIEVSIDDAASDFFTVIEVGGPDRLGFLYDVTAVLFELQLDVHIAKASTYGGRVIDAFYVRDSLGRKIDDREFIDEITAAIKARLSS